MPWASQGLAQQAPGKDRVEAKLIAPGIWMIRLGMPEKFTPVGLREDQPRTESLKNLPSIEQPPFDLSRIAFKITPGACVAVLPMVPDENIFGFGMNFKVFNATAKRRVMRVTDTQIIINNDQGDSHAPVPFYVSTRGYGVFADTARTAGFYCGNLTETAKQVEQDKSKNEIKTDVAEIYAQGPEPVKDMTIEVPVARGVDLYVFAGPDMKTAVARYNLFSGGGCLPPLWGLGVWYRGYTKYDAQEVIKLAAEFRQDHVPCDVFGLEPGWQTRTYSSSLVWSLKRWPDPEDFGRQMAGMGFRINIWEQPFINPDSPLFAPLKPYSGDYMVWNGLAPDFSLAKTRQIFADYEEREIIRKADVSGFKLDECDDQPLSPTPWSFPNITLFPSGMDGEQMHRLFGILLQRTINDIYKKDGLRTYGQVRSSGALAAPSPFVLYSDYYDHRDFVRALLNSGFSGLLWQPEVRDSKSIDDLYRRIQTAVFSPQTLVNAWYIKMPPWKQNVRSKNNQGDLMPNWKEVEAEIRKMFEVRMSLIPYLYSSFAQYRNKGLPPFRALVMDWPDDPKTYKLDDQYMMGEALLVAPLFAPRTEREVYLPPGEWYDFWTHKKYDGGRSYTIQKPAETIPVFVKGGTLLPLARPVEYVKDDTRFDVTAVAFGKECRPFELYEDDGLTYDFEKGKQNLLTLTWSPDKGGQVQKVGNYPGSRYNIGEWKIAREENADEPKDK
ncbi:MAG: TIM-barrel domain-containing protein [Thermoguttaceae bacterium]|jgi:alpha-D-xyloside xylohydrolase